VYPAWDVSLANVGPPLPREQIESRPATILYVGRLSAEKGVADLLDAIAMLARDRSVQARIVGDGDLRAALEAHARTIAMSGNVEFRGYVAEPFAEMRAADVLAVPSIREPFGMVIAEGMRCGVPVVSTLCDYGPGEQITDGENGLLVPVNDPRALAEAIARILDDPALATRLSSNAYRRSADFSPERMVSSFQDLVVRAAASRLGSAP
jgi:glycosyltransferase involved in cell wall biosynthesis